jgi:hypothetical protein
MNTTKKLYFIQNAEGDANAKEKTYYSEIINANYEKNKKSNRRVNYVALVR